MADPRLDAKLLGYLASVPPEQQGDLVAALQLAAASQRRGSWVRSIVIAAAALVGSGFTAAQYLHQLATKDDISRLERQYAAVAAEAAQRERQQDDRLTKSETTAIEAFSCCTAQQLRLDRFWMPGGVRP
jgi:hypothetical protein